MAAQEPVVQTLDRPLSANLIEQHIKPIFGLIFVGIEMRTNRAAAQVQIADGIAEGYLEINMAVVSDPALACVWSLGLEIPERLSDTQAGQFSTNI